MPLWEDWARTPPWPPVVGTLAAHVGCSYDPCTSRSVPQSPTLKTPSLEERITALKKQINADHTELERLHRDLLELKRRVEASRLKSSQPRYESYNEHPAPQTGHVGYVVHGGQVDEVRWTIFLSCDVYARLPPCTAVPAASVADCNAQV